LSNKLLELPIDERIRLVEDLCDSIAAEQAALSLSEAQKAELDRRLDAYEADPDFGREASADLAEMRREV